MKSHFSLMKIMTGVVLCTAVLTQVGCTGGGFSAKDVKLAEDVEVRVGGQETPPQVPEIVKPDDQTPSGENGSGSQNPNEEEVVLDDAGNVVPALRACSDEYMQRHNDIHQLLLRLASYSSSEDPSQEAEDRAVADLRQVNLKCQEFAIKYAGQSCRAKLKSGHEEVIASYRNLLKKECDIIAENVSKLDGQSDPSVDPSQDAAILTQDLVTLMGEDQVVEAKINDVAGFFAASNADQNISKVWMSGEVKEMTSEQANALAISEKKDFCAVIGFADIGGEGDLTHRMMKTQVEDAGTDLKSFTIHVMSYRVGQDATDHANGWLIKCSGQKESLQVNLQTLKTVFGNKLEAKIVGPQ